jgi:hypothetical protein
VTDSKIVYLDDPDMLLMMAAFFHDTGKFIYESLDRGYAVRVLKQIEEDTGSDNPILKSEIEVTENDDIRTMSEYLSVRVAGLYLPLMGFQEREIATICEVMEKDLMGKTAQANRDSGILKNKSVDELDEIFRLSDRIRYHYQDRKPRDLQINVIELSKRLFIADTCLSKAISADALCMVDDKYGIDPAKLVLWNKYENFLIEAYVREKS